MIKQIISSDDLRAAFELMQKSLSRQTQDFSKIFSLTTNSISFTRRALDEMRNRDLRIGDIINVLQACKIPYEPIFENGIWNCQVKTQKITVVIAFRRPGEVTVLRTWRN
jgi:hypothetical protein